MAGIGLQTAMAFAKNGIERLALADFNLRKLENTAEKIRRENPKIDILPLKMDVRNTAQVRSAFETISKTFGRLDIAVNSAGIKGPTDSTHRVLDQDWVDLIETNLSGVWRCQKEELKIMVGQDDRGSREGRGCIINVASIYGLIAPSRGLAHTAYTAAKHGQYFQRSLSVFPSLSKAGVIGLTKADAVVYGDHKIRLNSICPGFVPPLQLSLQHPSNNGRMTRTALLEAALNGAQGEPYRSEIARSSLGRVAEVEEVVQGIVFLASPASSFMQGTELVVDGGITLS